MCAVCACGELAWSPGASALSSPFVLSWKHHALLNDLVGKILQFTLQLAEQECASLSSTPQNFARVLQWFRSTFSSHPPVGFEISFHTASLVDLTQTQAVKSFATPYDVWSRANGPKGIIVGDTLAENRGRNERGQLERCLS